METSKKNSEYIAYWRTELQYRQHITQQKVFQARQSLPMLVNLLVNEFHATQIILFGSLVRGRFHGKSDIDLAVAGIAKKDYFRALTALNDCCPFPVDLKPLEDLDLSFRAKVERMGECLYEVTSS